MSTLGDLGRAVLARLIEDTLRKRTDSPITDAAKAAIHTSTHELEELIEFRARQLAEQFGLAMAVRDVADQVADVPKAFTPDGSVPDLGLDIEVVQPASWDDIKTPAEKP